MSGSDLAFKVGSSCINGEKLEISLPSQGERFQVKNQFEAFNQTLWGQVKVGYRTTPTSTALQWLQPEQTLAGTHPFLFSQCQATTILILDGIPLLIFSKYAGKESFLKTRILNMNYGRQSTVAPCCRARTPPRSRLPTPPQLLHPANLPHSCQQSGRITLYTREGTRDIVTNNRQGEPQPIEGDKSITKWEQKVRTINM